MNTTTLEASRSPGSVAPAPIANHPSLRVAPRSSAADRLALRLGLALVIWGRRHVARVDARDRAIARFDAERDRAARERAAERLARLAVPVR